MSVLPRGHLNMVRALARAGKPAFFVSSIRPAREGSNTMNKKFALMFFVIVLSLLATSVVGAQANPPELVTVMVNGVQVAEFADGGYLFQPGDTMTAPVLLQSTGSFTVDTFENRAALEKGERVGFGASVCATGLTGQEVCSIEVSGTTADYWFRIVHAHNQVGNFTYAGSNWTLNGMNLVFKPGATSVASPKVITSNSNFALNAYANMNALNSHTVSVSNVLSTCTSPLTAITCSYTVNSTDANTLIEILLLAAPTAPGVLVPVTTTAVPAAVVAPAVTPTPNTLVGQGGGSPAVSLPLAQGTVQQNGWTVTYYPGATDKMRAFVMPPLNVAGWDVFPNVDHAGSVAANLVEYGMDESQNCGSADDLCDLTVPPLSYVLITGDYNLTGIGACAGTVGGRGCAAVITNDGTVSADLTGILNNVHIVQGRFWNGDTLPEAVMALLSHASHNMTDQASALNPNGTANAGGNCSVATGCEEGTQNDWYELSGNELLLHAQVMYNMP